MPNRIERMTLVHRRVSPLEADLWIVVQVAHVEVGTTVCGRLTGPTCPGMETIQIAYPIRMIKRPVGEPENAVVGRVIIPEPNLWTQAIPFSYEGIVELWQDGVPIDSSEFKTSFQLR